LKALGDHRLRLILALTMAAFAVVIVRAVQVQAFDGPALAARGVSQHQLKILLPGLRGTIFSADGQPLAQEQPASDVAVDQREVKDVTGTAAALAAALGHTDVVVPHLPRKSTKAERKFVRRRHREHARYRRYLKGLERTLTGSKTYAYVAQQVAPLAADRIARLHLPGILLSPTERRFYPYGSLAAQLLGYTNIDSNGAAGAGLEQQYNHVLAGVNGQRVIVRDPTGTVLESRTTEQPRQGRDIHLTLDADVQQEVQRVITATLRSSGARAVTAIVMDPRTGAIKAMASAPSYDDNKVHDLSPASLARITVNSATNLTYEPGSIFKIVTYSAALSEGIISPDMVFARLPDEIHIADRVIRDDDYPRPPKTMTARMCLAESSNVCTDKIAGWVHEDGLLHWLYHYGFGRPTALHFPGESPGIVQRKGTWSGSTIGTLPIGQGGIAVTPMQMMDAYAAVANRGVMPQPHIVARIQGQPAPRLHTRRVLSPTVDRELVSMLKGVVNEPFGTGILAQIPGYTVAGKTGTAQKPNGHGGYAPGKYMASFIGFFPADDPQVEIMVVVDSPSSAIYGGKVAAPAFEQIGAWYAHYARIKSDRPATLPN
jgi:cell division protein FtsI (penicillin-binding protein 3)